MSPTQVHLMLNHVPVLGTIFVLVALAAGLALRNGLLQRFALSVLVGVALLAIPVLLTGNAAEDRVEHLAGISQRSIEAHEDVARPATWALAALGALALFGLLRSGRRELSRGFAAAMLALTLVMGGVMAWTAHLGGSIRHPEIGASTAAASETGGQTETGHEAEGDEDRD